MTLKKLYLLLLFSIQIPANLYSREVADSLMDKTGWLIYWHDKIIWVEAILNKKVNNDLFFKASSDYGNGLNISYNTIANVYRAIAKGYSISYPNSDINEKDQNPNISDSIWVLPVKVKVKTGFKPSAETMSLSFSKDGKDVFIDFKGMAEYSVWDVALLRNRDRRKLKRIKSFEVRTPL